MNNTLPPNNAGGNEISDTDRLAALHTVYPGWHAWYGRATGRWWALPPAAGDLIEASTIQQLGDKIEAAQRRGDLS